MSRNSSKLSSVILRELEDKTSYHQKVMPIVANCGAATSDFKDEKLEVHEVKV
jgi:hypothetical protein